MKIKKLYFFAAIHCILFLIITLIIKKAMYLFKLVLSRDDKSIFFKAIQQTEEFKILQSSENALAKQVQEFLDICKKETYYISSIHKDNIKLYGEAYTQDSNKWVIAVHGYTGTCSQMLSTAMRFYNKGFNVLTPDCRGHGKSEGEYISMGWHDRLDILSWINTLIEKDANCKIILYGLSMGGAAVLMASGEDLPKNVKCIIEDSAYTSVCDEFSYHLKSKYKISSWSMLYLVEFICKLKAGFTFREASTINQVKKCKIPILFIHGELDSLVPTSMAYKLFNEAKCDKELLIVPKAGHGICSSIGNKTYWNKIYNFIEKHGE